MIIKDATVIVINTCGFIDAAKEESVNTILEIADLKQTGQSKGTYCFRLSNTTIQRTIDE